MPGEAPARRYPSAAALAADLEAFVDGEPVAARPSGLVSFFDRLFRETHHAAVLENWGLLWMWHSLVMLAALPATQVIAWTGHGSHTVYLGLWSVGLVAWGTIFWQLRRRGGPVLFVERQIAHAWAAGVAASIGMFVLEVLDGPAGADVLAAAGGGGGDGVRVQGRRAGRAVLLRGRGDVRHGGADGAVPAGRACCCSASCRPRASFSRG